jgi:two-component system sensor histidine kinase UhpB
MNTHKSLRILLVDHNASDRELARQALTGAELPCLIDEAINAQEFETRLKTGRYDLVLTDLNIPGFGGLDVFERVQQAMPTTPVVMLTSTGDAEVAVEAMKRGMADYVLKSPEHIRLLPATVRAVLARVEAQSAAREAEERFQRLAENAPDMIFRWSYARGFEYVSPASTEVVGFTPEEHYADPGMSYRALHPDDIPIYDSIFSDLADPEGPRRHAVIRWIHRDGHVVHVETRMTPIFDERGELIAIEGINRDISQHVHARERLRELTQRLTRAHEDERQRIARELHDEIGQALAVVKMRLRMTREAITPENTKALEKLSSLSAVVDETLAGVRALSHELRPPLIDEMGWEPALSWLCESMSQRTELPIRYACHGPSDRLDPSLELTAYRVVQEALANVVRHAQATHAAVEAALGPETLTIQIEDDGVGFDLNALHDGRAAQMGLGLLGMQERVELVQGEVTIETRPGKGTRVTVCLPRKEGVL